MNFCVNSRPLQPKRKKLNGQLSKSQVFGIFVDPTKALQRSSQVTPGKLRNSGIIKLQSIKRTEKTRLNVYPTNNQAFKQLKICMDSIEAQPKLPIKGTLKKNSSCHAIQSKRCSPNSPKQETTTKQLKNYFKHLNLEAKNHSSFIGTSALLHKRQIHLKLRSRSYRQVQQERKSYRNGYESIMIKASPTEQSSETYTGRSLKYQFGRSYLRKQQISPWQGSIEADSAPMPKLIAINVSPIKRARLNTN